MRNSILNSFKLFLSLHQNKRILFSNCFLVTLVFFVSNIQAQTIKFQKVYGGYSYDYGNDLIQMDDTGYVLLCTSSSLTGNSQIYILKVDKNGDYVWQKDYGGSEVEGASEIKRTNDGNLIAAGYTSSFGNGSYDSYLLKLTPDGDTIWTKHYGGDDWDFTYSVDTCADSGYILAGKTYSNGIATSDILITKVDENGTLQWSKTYGGNKDDVANSIISLTDGYVICGTTASMGAGMNDIYVFKIDLNGDMVWERTFGDTLNDEGNDVAATLYDNKLIITGNTTLINHPGHFYPFILKAKLDGGNDWLTNNLSYSVNDHFLSNSIVEGFNGRITTCGASDGNSPGIFDAITFMWDKLGYYNQSGTFGGSSLDYGENVIKTNDYGYALIGTTNSFGIGLSNIFFIKTDTLEPSIANLSIFVNTTVQELPKEENKAVLYPNPFNQSTTITINYPVAIVQQKVKLLIWNNLGEEVSQMVSTKLTQNGNQSSLQIDNLFLNSGLYHYQLLSGNKQINAGNFTVVKE